MRPTAARSAFPVLALLAVTAFGCSLPPDTDRAGDGAPAPGDTPPAAPEEVATPAAVGPPRPVRVTVQTLPSSREGAIAFIGFAPEQMDGPWPIKGQAPRYHMVSPKMPLAARLDFEIGLVGPASYIAVLDLDDDGVPDEGELTSLPVSVPTDPGAEAPVFPLASAFNEKGPPRPGSGVTEPGVAPDGEVSAGGKAPSIERSLVVDSTIRPPFLKKGRLLVVAMPPAADGRFRGPLHGAPSFLWASDLVPLDWPVTVSARFPANGDLLVILDLDGAGLPSLGDLASAPMLAFTPPAEGKPVTAQLTGPLVEEGEGGE